MARKPPKTRRPLTVKQKRFADAYDGNAVEAALKAGYKGDRKALKSMGSCLLRVPLIAARVKAREDKRTNNAIATREQRQEFWTKTMNNVRAKMCDRLRASELLGKSECDFRTEVTGANGGPIRIEDERAAISGLVSRVAAAIEAASDTGQSE